MDLPLSGAEWDDHRTTSSGRDGEPDELKRPTLRLRGFELYVAVERVAERLEPLAQRVHLHVGWHLQAEVYREERRAADRPRPEARLQFLDVHAALVEQVR